MRIQDLGVLTGEILLFGGIYSNLPALDALLSIVQGRGIAPHNMICTGDVVAYCADAEASVNRMRALGCPVLSGNCEVQLAQGADDCGCGFEDGSTCSALSARWYAHAQNQVSLESKVWMGELPDRIVFTHEGKRYAVVHGGASNIASNNCCAADPVRCAPFVAPHPTTDPLRIRTGFWANGVSSWDRSSRCE